MIICTHIVKIHANYITVAGDSWDPTGAEEAILHWSGKSFKHELYVCGKQDYLQNLENLVYECTGPIVRSTISMRSMLMLGGSGGMPPQENFEK